VFTSPAVVPRQAQKVVAVNVVVAVAGVITVGHGHGHDQDHDDDHHQTLRLGAWRDREKACLSELVRSFISLVAGLGVQLSDESRYKALKDRSLGGLTLSRRAQLSSMQPTRVQLAKRNTG
jgi:hypothetical protein